MEIVCNTNEFNLKWIIGLKLLRCVQNGLIKN